MSLENGKFNHEHAILPEFLEKPTLKDMVTGMIGSIDPDLMLIDSSRKCWIDGDAEFKSAEDAWDEELTIVRLNEGYVVDLSGDVEKEPRFSIATEYEIVHDASDNLLPVIGFVVSDVDLLSLDKQYTEQTGQRYIAKSERKQLKKRVKVVQATIKEALRSDR